MKKYTKLKLFCRAAALPTWVFGPLWFFLTANANLDDILTSICVIPISLFISALMVFSLILWRKEIWEFMMKYMIYFLAFCVALPLIIFFVVTGIFRKICKREALNSMFEVVFFYLLLIGICKILLILEMFSWTRFVIISSYMVISLFVLYYIKHYKPDQFYGSPWYRCFAQWLMFSLYAALWPISVTITALLRYKVGRKRTNQILC